ncbi:unnamed protein product [Linum trigynum]|uniref:Uncharacterized protein n=1 Tax=Linum trigynum TaxID=586398 RepID=A0AAV2ENH3_9ROSI
MAANHNSFRVKLIIDKRQNKDMQSTKHYLLNSLRGETHVKKVPLLPANPHRCLERTIYSCNEPTHNPRCAGVDSVGLVPRKCAYDVEVRFLDSVGWCREADFVKPELRFLVKDDLSVRHFDFSIMSGLSFLTTEFGVTDFGGVEERVVQVGVSEGMRLLEAFMHTTSALTTVFLGNK